MLTFMLGGIISKLALGPGVALEIKKTLEKEIQNL